MSELLFLVMMMGAMEEEEERRKKRREEKEEKEKRRREEHRKMVEHRKNSPVIYNDEKWQIERCVKAISLQSCVQKLVKVVEKVKQDLITTEEKKYDDQILELGNEYELYRNNLDSDIKTLAKMGITIDGYCYKLVKPSSINTKIAVKPDITYEYFGNNFTIMNNEPIDLNQDILSDEKYFEDRYNNLYPDEVAKQIIEVKEKMKKYEKYGKVFGFLLSTRKYYNLEDELRELNEKKELCELRKREMESYNLLTKEQLLIIKSYFINIDKLIKKSKEIYNLFNSREFLKRNTDTKYFDNGNYYDSAIKEIMNREEYSELVSEVNDYISNIQSNDPETMESAYELVKGEYPIEIERRFIYGLIITNLSGYNKEEEKRISLHK